MVELLCVVYVCLILATNVLTIAFKAKNDLPTTWSDVKSMAIRNGITGIVLVVLVAAVAIR